MPGEIVCEDAARHRRLRVVDLPFAADRLAVPVKLLDDVVAEAQAATGLPFLNPAAQSAARLVGKIP
ncbi:hypothetical protein [Mesorhizobium sp. L-8-3]|uniref:hypothetical protein n=1 Tax=Mesorhizobium sp. L-8-3 TaxID=2744522 RepID=UPI001FD45073|nr:hypothetical protein [Mesorhizobium sp. L-8-3]